jgi:hypothetical protein
MDNMRVALEEALSIRVRLPLLKAHVGDADNQADDRNESYHFSVFSLIYIDLAACGYDDAIADGCHDLLSR